MVNTPLPWRPLQPHPSTRAPTVERVLAMVTASANVLRLEMRLEGALEHVCVPSEALDPLRLWEHTCAELFIAGDDARYVEWNFSPTGQSTRFEFSSYRERVATATHVPVRVECTRVDDALHLVAEGPLGIDDAVAASITAVVRAPDGQSAYWALAHGGPKPDFHDRTTFVLDAAALRP